MATTITVSTEDALFPKSNLIDGDYSVPFRFTVTTGGFIELDFLAPVTFDSVFIGNHNFDPAATFLIEVGASSPPGTIVDTPGYRVKNVLSKFTSVTFRFLRITIVDAGTDITEIGELVVGLRTILPRGLRFGKVMGIRQESILERTNRGKRYALELFKLENRTYSIRFLESERAQVLAFWEAINGALDPFVWVEDNDEADPAESLFVSLENPGFFPRELTDPAPDAVFDWQFSVIEEGLGTAIET